MKEFVLRETLKCSYTSNVQLLLRLIFIECTEYGNMWNIANYSSSLAVFNRKIHTGDKRCNGIETIVILMRGLFE